MSDRLLVESVEGRCLSPEEQLTRCVANALQQSGYPPLQYLDVKAHDGHVYLSARVPTLFLTRRTHGTGSQSSDSLNADDAGSLVTFVPF